MYCDGRRVWGLRLGCRSRCVFAFGVVNGVSKSGVSKSERTRGTERERERESERARECERKKSKDTLRLASSVLDVLLR